MKIIMLSEQAVRKITSNPRRHTHNETTAELKNAITWAKEHLGLRTESTRFSTYYKTLANSKPLKNFENYKNHLLTLKEINEFITIYRAFRDEPKENILVQVESIISGKPYRQDRRIDKSDTSRNFLLELSIAARLKLSGAKVETKNISDIVVRFENTNIYIECKRVRSERKLLKRIHKADGQITERTKTTNNAHGYITVDVTDLLCTHKDIETYDSMDHFCTESTKRLANLSRKYEEKIRSSISDTICSVIFCSHVLGKIEHEKNYRINIAYFFHALTPGNLNKEKSDINSKFLPLFAKQPAAPS